MMVDSNMAAKIFNDTIQAFSRSRFLILLIVILLMVALAPFLDVFVSTRILMDIFLTATFVAIIHAFKARTSSVIIAAVLASPLIILTWANYFVEFENLVFIWIFGALFFGYAAVNIWGSVFNAEAVKKETIFAAVVAYLLIAVMWAFLFLILEMLVPGSFAIHSSQDWSDLRRFQYLSFVTITTLGYGDITPLTEKASALTMLEAVIGQIYMVVVVAWLVGMHVSRKSK